MLPWGCTNITTYKLADPYGVKLLFEGVGRGGPQPGWVVMLVHPRTAPLTNKRSYRLAARCNLSLQGWSFTAQQFEELEVHFAVLAADKAERLQPLSPAFVDLVEGLHNHIARRTNNNTQQISKTINKTKTTTQTKTQHKHTLLTDRKTTAHSRLCSDHLQVAGRDFRQTTTATGRLSKAPPEIMGDWRVSRAEQEVGSSSIREQGFR